MHRARLKFAALAILYTPGIFAASITGAVLDPQGLAVKGAAITLFATNSDTELKTVTGTGGSYRFDQLKAGDYLIEAHAAGFSEYRTTNVHISADADSRIDLHLAVSTVQQQVSVTAASTPQAVDQVSKALSIVDNTAIQERQDYALGDAIRFTPGVRIEQLGGPGAFTNIHLRGLRPEDTAVLVDGLRLRDPSGTQADASSFIEDFLLPDTSRIEILRGSGSSLYGTDAIGGVVNVIMNQGGGPTHGSVQVEGGGLGLLRGTALISGGSKSDRIEYSAGLMHLNVTEGVGGDAPARTSSVQGRVAFRLTPGMQLVARFLGSDSFSKLNTEPVAIADYPTGITAAIPLVNGARNATYIPSTDDPDSTEALRFETGALTLLGQPTSKLGYTINYQVVDSFRRYGNGPAGAGFQPFGNTLSTYSGRIQTVTAQANYQPGRYSLLTGGYEYEKESYGNGSSAALSPGSDSSTNAAQGSNAVFLQDQVRLLADRLYLSVSARAQYFNLEKPQFAPSANAPYQTVTFAAPPAAYTGDGSLAYFVKRSGTKLRAHAGRGYRAPSLYERFGSGYDSFFGYSVYGDPLLKPEQSISADAGIDQSLLHEKLRLSATYFYTHLQRVIIFDFSGLLNPVTDPFGRFTGYLNTSGGFARGVEFNTNWAITPSLTVSGSYTYTDARERTPLVPNVYRSFAIPQNQLAAFAVQRLGERAYVDFTLEATDYYLAQVFSSFASGAFRFPGLKRAGLGGSYRIPISEDKGIRIFARAENLFDQTYYESGFRTPGLTARGGLQFEF